MSPTQRRTVTRPQQSGWVVITGSDATSLVLMVGAAVLGAAAVLWTGAVLATYASGRPHVPDGGLLPAVRALAHLGEPAQAWPHPTQLPTAPWYWSVTGFLILFVMGIAAAIKVTVTTHGHREELDRIRQLPGLATPREADKVSGLKVLLDRAPVIRPSRKATKDPHDLGYRIGSTGSRSLWCAVEDSALLIGPPRMGKGLHVVIPWVLDAPGPVVVTSTRPDTLAVTFKARGRREGPVAIFDPQGLAGRPGGLKWSPVRGCDRPRTALVRARGLAAGTGFGTTSDGDFWQGQTETALRCLLHAAALDGRRAIDLYRWSLNPVLADDAVAILAGNPHAADGWADALDAVVHVDPRTRDSIWLGVRQALAALADPDVLAAVDPDPKDEFHPAKFLQESGTLYLLASAVASGSSAPLIAAFVEDITETARVLAARSPSARLDPPLLLALDEIANLTPLPSLPSLMAEGGGSGITTLAVLQSLAQARHRWGEHSADAIWDAATTKIILGGLGKFRDLDDIARLLGDIDEPTQSYSHARTGERTATTSLRTVPVMPPSVLRTLPVGTAVLLLRHTRPVVVDLTPWLDRPDAPQLHRDQTDMDSATTAVPSMEPEST